MGFERFVEQRRAQAERRRLEHEARKAALRQQVAPVLARFGVRRAVLFGSLAQGGSTAASDVDLLVMPLQAADYWALRHELEQTLAMPVDLYTQDDDPQLVAKVLARGEVIYDA